MIATKLARERWHPSSDEERLLVQRELQEILSTTQFSGSKRYPAFLRYVVEKELQGKGDDLKERTIGIEVFDRPPDYDTNNDTIVRFAAGEVRKRLERFYHEAPTSHPLHIHLRAGSYAPEFLRVVPEAVPAEAAEATPPEALLAAAPARYSLSRKAFAAFLLLAVLCSGASLTVWLHLRSVANSTPSINQFWGPFIGSPTPVLICPGTVTSATRLFGSNRPDKDDDYPFVSVETATTLARVTSLFGVTHIPYMVEPTPGANLTELRAHPVVLIGGYTNEWTLRLLQDLRFRFSPLPLEQIVDSTRPASHWARFVKNPDDSSDDYAIVARYRDPLTENWTIVIAGLGRNGTEAAAEFVSSPRYLDPLIKSLPKGWSEKNLEIVVKTNVIANKSSAPSVAAIDVW